MNYSISVVIFEEILIRQQIFLLSVWSHNVGTDLQSICLSVLLKIMKMCFRCRYMCWNVISISRVSKSITKTVQMSIKRNSEEEILVLLVCVYIYYLY